MRRKEFHGCGKQGTPEFRTYRVWQLMLQRCHNPKNTGFYKYGARGISVCLPWRESFVQFLRDMGMRPEGTSLDRIDNDGNYEPSNCRWATPEQQLRNTRRSVIIDGVCALDHSRALGSKRGIVNGRLKRGWTMEAAISTPKLTPSEAGKRGNNVRNGR